MAAAQITYRIRGLRDGQWIAQQATEEQDQAVALAKSHVEAMRFSRVQVIRRAAHRDEAAREEIVFEAEAPNQAKETAEGEPNGLPSPEDFLDGRKRICESLDDFYSLSSRLEIGRGVRAFLNERHITPSELLHDWAHIRKLQDDPRLMSAATHRIGLAQAKLSGVEPKERLRRLQLLIDAATRAARDFADDRRRVPRVDLEDIERSARRIERHVGKEKFGFAFMAQLSAAFQGRPNVLSRLEYALIFAETVGPSHLDPYFDQIAADVMGFADAVPELFGGQMHRAGMIRRLAAFIRDEPKLTKGLIPPRNDLLQRIESLVRDGRFAECRLVAVDWLHRELTHSDPLHPRDPETEEELVHELAPALVLPDGSVLGGPSVERAWDQRRMRARQQQLRKMGMWDVAEKLPLSWVSVPLSDLVPQAAAG